MKQRHPFMWIAESSRTRTGIVAALIAFGLLITLQALNAPLSTNAAPSGIISYELAGDVATAEEILDSWGPAGRVYAGLSLGLDYLFLFTYAIAIGLVCVLTADRLRARAAFLSTLGFWLAWGMIAAGAFDFVENYGLIRMLIGEGKPWWPTIAYWCAVIKFILVGLGLAYLVVGFIVELIRSERQGSAAS
jgi:hypothetical protein